jgi:tetratricopeptide (TPR) repeat protein
VLLRRDGPDLLLGPDWLQREVESAAPQHRPGWRGLGDTLLRAGRIENAEELSRDLLNKGDVRIEGLLLRSGIALAAGWPGNAREALDQAIAEAPADLEVLPCGCQFLFEQGEVEEAEGALRSLIAPDPSDASTYHNLRTLLLRAARYDEAVQSFRQSLRFRSNHPPTYLNLGYALKESGRLQEEVKAWEQALRLSPGDPAVRRELMLVGLPC